MTDELDRADVRERLADLRTRAVIERDSAAFGIPPHLYGSIQPLPEGGEGKPIDPWGRGPASPFYSPRPKPEEQP